MQKDPVPELDQKRLLKELGDTGFGFQHAVAETIQREGGAWRLEYTEFPVSVRGRPAHIDIVAWCGGRVLMVAECKRVNPAYSDWLFAKWPPSRYEDHRGARLDRLLKPDQGDVRVIEPVLISNVRAYHIPLEVKTARTGDQKGQARSLREAIYPG